MPTCLVVQHLAPEGPYAIADALVTARVDVEVCRPDRGGSIPRDVSGLDGLVVMGGPMSARSDDGFSTRAAELELLAGAARAGVPTLGVCLGAQLLAAATGGSVVPGTGPEIGWGPVDLLPACADDPLFCEAPRELTVLHWHGETYRPPADATALASNSRYSNQAFRVGEAAWGLQFHLEVTADAVDAFLAAFGAEADASSPGGAAGLRRATLGSLALLADSRARVLTRFAGLVAARATTGTAA
jgi:GMP synthase-like glutamine amidotransferase